MARIKISKVAKDLNVSVATVVEALRKKNITVPDDNPNFRLEEAEADILYQIGRASCRETNPNSSLHRDRKIVRPIKTHRLRLQHRLRKAATRTNGKSRSPKSAR